MSVSVSEVIEQNIVEVTISGKLTREAYAEFVPMTEDLIKQYGKVRILVQLHDFHGWDAGALWEDVKFDLKHFSDIARLAIVGETKWEKGMSSFCRVFTTAEIRYFEEDSIDQARAWIRA